MEVFEEEIANSIKNFATITTFNIHEIKISYLCLMGNIVRIPLKSNPSKSDPVVELDLIFLSQKAEKWKEDIESLLKEIENITIKARQINSGDEIQNKWIGICEANFEGCIDDVTSIPENCIPNTELPGMIIMIEEQHMKKGEEFVIEKDYPDKRIHYITRTGFPGDACRATRAVRALIEGDLVNADSNKYIVDKQDDKKGKEADVNRPCDEPECESDNVEELAKPADERIGIEGKEARAVDGLYDTSECRSDFVEGFTKSTEARHGKKEKPFSADKITDDCNSDETVKVKQSLFKFLNSILDQNFSQTLSKIPSSSLYSQIKRESSTSEKQSGIGQQEHKFSFTFGNESICWVVYDVQSVTKLITVHENENLDEIAHIIMEKDGIDENCHVNSLALTDIKRFIQESALDEINVITHTLDKKTREHLGRFLNSKLERVKVTFLESGAIPKHPWILVCPEKHNQADENFKEPNKPKGLKYMVITIHGEWDSPEEVKIRNSQTDTPTIHLLFKDSMIDDSYYLNQHAKAETHRLLKKYRTVHIKCLSDFPRKAFSGFVDKYITSIEPIWVTGEELVGEGSLCIIVCFTLARLLDDISAVIKITQQDCINMLVVTQNCREGISPGPMLNHNPDSCFTDFTNILYGDGECYECEINLEAKAKIQSFINRN